MCTVVIVNDSWIFSFFSKDEVREAMNDLTKVARGDSEMSTESRESHETLAVLCSSLSRWMDSYADEGLTDYQDFNSSSKIWTGRDILAVFQAQGIVSPASHETLREHVQKVNAEWQVRLRSQVFFFSSTIIK